jgi:hypothetical protein
MRIRNQVDQFVLTTFCLICWFGHPFIYRGSYLTSLQAGHVPLNGLMPVTVAVERISLPVERFL